MQGKRRRRKHGVSTCASHNVHCRSGVRTVTCVSGVAYGWLLNVVCDGPGACLLSATPKVMLSCLRSFIVNAPSLPRLSESIFLAHVSECDTPSLPHPQFGFDPTTTPLISPRCLISSPVFPCFKVPAQGAASSAGD
eukprot:5628234-Alexandrium_andersonii.AAC.1